MNNITVGKILGAVAAHVASVTTGIDASTEVAAKCLGGRSLGSLFVFHSTFDVDSRYLGMRKAFGEDTELFKVAGSNPPQPLGPPDYDKLITAALAAAKTVAAAKGVAGATPPIPTPALATIACATNAGSASATIAAGEPIIEEPNPYLCVHANFPIIQWGRGIHHWFVTSLYTLFALGAMLVVAMTRWWCKAGGPGLPEALYFVTFIVISAFTFVMLDVRREVYYIPIAESDISDGVRAAWHDLKGGEHPELPAKDPKALRAAAHEAVADLKNGLVRVHAGKVYVPVMAVTTVVEDDLASWLLLLHDLPGPLMSSGLFFLPNSRLNWGVAYGVAAYIQSRLQHAVAERYIKDAKTRGVFWFRKLKEYEYEVHDPYRLDSDVFKIMRESSIKPRNKKRGIPW